MEKIKYELRMKILDSALIVDNFVKGIPEYSNEDYLRDFLNKSNWFRTHYKGTFIKPQSESKGECDAEADNYSLDFKLIVAKTRMQASSILRPQVYVPVKGVTVHGGPKKTGGKINATRIHAALRYLSLGNLEEIREIKEKKQGVENDIVSLLKKMEVRKNLFLFFPYELFYCEKGSEDPVIIGDGLSYDLALQDLQDRVEADFKVLFAYRKKYVPELDTYFSFIFQRNLLIYKICGSDMVYIDKVSTEMSDLFTELENYGAH